MQLALPPCSSKMQTAMHAAPSHARLLASAALRRWPCAAPILPAGASSAGCSPRCSAVASSSSAGAEIYSRPQLYTEAFSYRDIKQEVKFLRAAYDKHAAGSAGLRSVLDLGCGPGEHAIGLAQCGVAHVVGLDACSEMVAHATASAQAKGVSCHFVQGDLCSFSPPAPLTPGGVDLALCLLGTFTHVLTNAQALEAFRCVARALRPGGVFILELGHPGDLYDGTLLNPEPEIWEADGKGGNKMMIEWGSGDDDFDPVTQVLQRTVTVTVTNQQKEVVQTVEDQVPARQYTCAEIDLLARCCGELEVVGMYGDMDVGVGLRHEDAHRMVVCLRKL